MGFERVMNFVKSKESLLFNAMVAVAIIGGQHLFCFLAFKCPCQPCKNVFYGTAFIGVPALILLVVGYVLNNHTWRLVSGRGMRHKCRRDPKVYNDCNRLMHSKLKTFVCCNITGHALTAPVTWVAATMLNGSYYICALSEFESVDLYEPLQSFNRSELRRILVTFSCPQLVHPNLTKVAEAVLLDLRYQSQVGMAQCP